MKQIVLFLMLLCCNMAPAQVQKLSELSSGKFLDSSVIMEEDESDVFGYCLLYEQDRKSKEVFELEYVILDKNLNKLTSISLTQAVFKTFMAKTRAELTFVKKIGSQLTIAVNDRLVNIGEFDIMPFFNYRFINVNLDSFTFSKEYKYEGFAKKEYDYKSGDKMSFYDFWDLQQLIKTKSSYFVSFATPEHNPKTAAISNMESFKFKREKSVKRFAVLDKDLNTVWSKDINIDKNEGFKYSYLDSDNDVLLIKKEVLTKKALECKNIEVYDIKTGMLLGEIKLEDPTYAINFDIVHIVKDKIHVFANLHEMKKKGWSQGYAHLIFNKQSVKETNHDYILWKNLGTVIPGMSEYGGINEEYSQEVQDFIITPKGTTLMVLEAYNVKSKTNMLTNTVATYAMLKDMYMIEFNPDNSIAFSKKIEKKNSVQIWQGMSGADMRKYGVFDYIYSQKVNNDGDFVLFYTINDQEGTIKKVAKKPLWTMGITSNVAGEYGFETLPLYGTDLKIYPGMAKNGYIRLTEINQKTGQAEMRLEKINY